MTQTNLDALNRDLLKAAIEASGWTVQESSGRINFYVPGVGVATIDGDTLQLTERTSYYRPSTAVAPIEELKRKLKVAYSKEAVKSAAKQFGWQTTAVGDNKLKLKRRA